MTQQPSSPSTPATSTKTILLYACSGAANVGEIADRVARRLTAEGLGKMFCAAGIGAGVPDMVQTAREADLNLVLSGCSKDCARLLFEQAGLTNTKFLRLTDHGLEKAKGVPITEEQIDRITALARQALATA